MNSLTVTNSSLERPRELTVDDLARWVENPSLAIPAPMRLAAKCFWIEWRAIGKDELSFYSRIARYHREGGLTLDDMRDVFAKMNEPGRAEKMRYTGDFFAELAGLVATTIRDRKGREEMLRRRMEAERDRAQAVPPGAMREILAGIGLGGA